MKVFRCFTIPSRHFPATRLAYRRKKLQDAFRRARSHELCAFQPCTDAQNDATYRVLAQRTPLPSSRWISAAELFQSFATALALNSTTPHRTESVRPSQSVPRVVGKIAGDTRGS